MSLISTGMCNRLPVGPAGPLMTLAGLFIDRCDQACLSEAGNSW